MNTSTMSALEKEVKEAVENLIENAAVYNVEKVNDIYDDSMKAVMIDEKGKIEVVTKQKVLDFFAAKRAAGDEPLNERNALQLCRSK